MSTTDVCRHCGTRLHLDGDTWVDETEGDACWDLDNENQPHVPAIAGAVARGELRAERLNAWTHKLTEMSEARTPGFGYSFFADKLRSGARYVRIVGEGQHGGKHVHAFVEWATGDVYKAAGWKAPAKHVRFNLFDDASFERMLDVCDPHGSYLYLNK